MNEDILKILKEYAVLSTKEAKAIIKKSDSLASGDLYNSLELNYTDEGGDIQLTVNAVDYATFIDSGVKGSQSTYPSSKASPYKYKNKLPPKEPIAKWMKLKGIKGRDKKTGRFIKQDSANFLIRKSINKKGIKGIHFTDAYSENMPKLEKALLKVVDENITDAIIGWLNDIKFNGNNNS